MNSFTSTELKEIYDYIDTNLPRHYWEYDDHLSSRKVHRNGLIFPSSNGLSWDGGETFTDSNLNAWNSYTPTLSNIVKGSATLDGKYKQIGKLVFGRVDLVLAADSSVTGTINVSLPITSVTYSGTADTQPIGMATYYDVGGASYEGVSLWSTTSTLRPKAYTADATYVGLAVVNATAPFTWAGLSADEMHFNFCYEAA